jgi:hypothetical protein
MEMMAKEEMKEGKIKLLGSHSGRYEEFCLLRDNAV